MGPATLLTDRASQLSGAPLRHLDAAPCATPAPPALLGYKDGGYKAVGPAGARQGAQHGAARRHRKTRENFFTVNTMHYKPSPAQ